jgi:NAD(P)H-dependent FMN reductase
MGRRILAIHTSTHDPDVSSSAALTRAALERMLYYEPRTEVQWIDAAKLTIAKNLSCYANGKTHCADPKAGEYRCWANVMSRKDPEKYGVDQMPEIYDGLAWADTVLFSTSTRWGSHSAVAQNIIERMNTLENRGSSYGEPYPMRGKRLGVIASGLHWKTYRTAKELLETLKWWGFATQGDDNCVLAWQRTDDPFFEHPDSDTPYAEKWLLSRRGLQAVDRFAHSVTTATKVIV